VSPSDASSRSACHTGVRDEGSQAGDTEVVTEGRGVEGTCGKDVGCGKTANLVRVKGGQNLKKSRAQRLWFSPLICRVSLRNVVQIRHSLPERQELSPNRHASKFSS